MKKSLQTIQSVFFALATLALLPGCSISKLQKQGHTIPESFHAKLPFETYKTVMVMEANINGVSRNMIFDTGADYNLIQRDQTEGKLLKADGASKRSVRLGSETTQSLKIGSVDFANTYSLNGDLKGLKEQIPNFGGLIGQPVIKKANWLIDYPNKKLEIANKRLIDDTYKEIEIDRKDGAPYTYIEVFGERYRVIIDFGSSSTINLPKESKLAKALSSKIAFKENVRDRYTLGGLQVTKEQVGEIPTVNLGPFEMKNVAVNINTSSQPRIGISFFKDYTIYIDNDKGGAYWLKKTNKQG